ncbi:MAG: tetratricopeptide repeat protein [Rickettsiales bacterium]
MRIASFLALIFLVSSCDYHGGALPVDGKKVLEDLEGPKIKNIKEVRMDSAQQAKERGDYVMAYQLYQQILEKEPNNLEITELFADSKRRAGEYDDSISVYDSILAKDSGNLEAMEGKSLALIAKGDFETPTSILDKVIKKDPTRWKSLNAMGILFVTRELYPESVEYFESALKQSPNNISIMNNLGLSYALNKNYKKSLDYLTKASSISSIGSMQRKRIDLNMALVYAGMGNLEEAKAIAESYLSGPLLNNNLGLYAHLAKDDELAKSYLNMALTESKVYYSKAWENLDTIKSLQYERDDKSSDGKSKTIKLKDNENKVEKKISGTTKKLDDRVMKDSTSKAKVITPDSLNNDEDKEVTIDSVLGDIISDK